MSRDWKMEFKVLAQVIVGVVVVGVILLWALPAVWHIVVEMSQAFGRQWCKASEYSWPCR